MAKANETTMKPGLKKIKDGLEKELAAMNQVGIGTIPIDKYKQGDIDGRKLPSKPELIALVQELYSLAKKSIGYIRVEDGESSGGSGLKNGDEITTAIGRVFFIHISDILKCGSLIFKKGEIFYTFQTF